MILLESITTRLQQDYPKFTLSFLWFYRNHYGKFTASFEQIPNVYFGDIKKWLGRGLIQWLPKVIIPPCPFSCFRCVLRCVPFPCVLKSLFLLRSTVRSSVLRSILWMSADDAFTSAWDLLSACGSRFIGVVSSLFAVYTSVYTILVYALFCCHLLCHLLDCHLALVEFDFRFSGRKW